MNVRYNLSIYSLVTSTDFLLCNLNVKHPINDGLYVPKPEIFARIWRG